MPHSRESLPRSSDPAAAPPDWQRRWDQPLDWLAPGGRTGSTPARRGAPLDLADAALVVIDIDKKALDMQVQLARRNRSYLARRIYRVALPNIIRLVQSFRARQRPVIFVQWGWHRYQYPPLEPAAGEEVVVKRGRGAFGTSSLDAALRQKRVRTLVVAGADTVLCVDSTVRGAVDHGYRAVLVEDACVCTDPRMHAMAVRTLGYGTAQIARTSQTLAALRRRSGNLNKKPLTKAGSRR